MLRPGRLDRKLYVDLPKEEERVQILRTHFRSRAIDYIEGADHIARGCKGYSGADLEILLRKAGEAAVKRDDCIKIEDFEAAKEKTRPSVTDMARYEALKRDWGTGV